MSVDARPLKRVGFAPEQDDDEYPDDESYDAAFKAIHKSKAAFTISSSLRMAHKEPNPKLRREASGNLILEFRASQESSSPRRCKGGANDPIDVDLEDDVIMDDNPMVTRVDKDADAASLRSMVPNMSILPSSSDDGLNPAHTAPNGLLTTKPVIPTPSSKTPGKQVGIATTAKSTPRIAARRINTDPVSHVSLALSSKMKASSSAPSLGSDVSSSL